MCTNVYHGHCYGLSLTHSHMLHIDVAIKTHLSFKCIVKFCCKLLKRVLLSLAKQTISDENYFVTLILCTTFALFSNTDLIRG